MAEFIPQIRELFSGAHRHRVPEGFADAFVRLHAGDWRTARAHWEGLVELVLSRDGEELTRVRADLLREYNLHTEILQRIGMLKK